MSRHRFIIEVDVDDDALARGVRADHPFAPPSPPADVAEWSWLDLVSAYASGIVDLDRAHFTHEQVAS